MLTFLYTYFLFYFKNTVHAISKNSHQILKRQDVKMSFKNFAKDNVKLFIILILCVHTIEAKVLNGHPSVANSTSDTMGAITKQRTVELMEEEDDIQFVTPQRYSINPSLVFTTDFAKDFCRRISSCFKCVQSGCVYKGHPEDDLYVCRHSRVDEIEDENDSQEFSGSWMTLKTTHDCVQLTKVIGMRLNDLEETKQLLSYLELVGVISIILILLTLSGLLLGFMYVTRRLEFVRSGSSPSTLTELPSNPDKILIYSDSVNNSKTDKMKLCMK